MKFKDLSIKILIQTVGFAAGWYCADKFGALLTMCISLGLLAALMIPSVLIRKND